MDIAMQEDLATDAGLAKACVVACLESNHANTFALLEILRACSNERPYREVEAEVSQLPVMHMTHQNAHVLAEMLVNCGGLEKIDVPEEAEYNDPDGEAKLEGDSGKQLRSEGYPAAADGAESTAGENEAACADLESTAADQGVRHIAFANPGFIPQESGEPFGFEEEDMPIDYLLVMSEAGRAALAEYEPSKRLKDMVDSEDSSYRDIFKEVLAFCAESEKVTSDGVEEMLADHPAMRAPKVVYAGYFISRLETAGGIVWVDGGWKPTEAGRHLLKAL